MGLSFREKSLVVLFVGLVVAFGVYFAKVLPDHGRDVQPEQMTLFVAVVVGLVIVQIVGHILIAVFDRRTSLDERDRLIALKGARNASYVLATGNTLALGLAVLVPGNFAFTHALLAFWVLAQLVEVGSQLYLNRRGA